MSTGHDWFPTEPISARKPVAWPGGARVAMGFVVSVEHYEMFQPPGAVIPVTLPGGFGRGPYPDFRSYSHREYGNRVGIFRLLELFERLDMKATAAIDAGVAKSRKAVVDACLERGWEIAAHGNAVTQVLSSALTEDEERRQVASALDSLERATGKRPAGWHGPEYGESARTPGILAAAGVQYVLDWPNDELPYAMATPSGSLVSLPMMVDFDDVFAHWYRKLTMKRWVQSIAEALDQLLEDGGTRPRMLLVNLHPWLTGQPWRISYLEEVLRDVRWRDGVWLATAGEIAEAWRTQFHAEG